MIIEGWGLQVASFPGLAHLLLAVQNSRRRANYFVLHTEEQIIGRISKFGIQFVTSENEVKSSISKSMTLTHKGTHMYKCSAVV